MFRPYIVKLTRAQLLTFLISGQKFVSEIKKLKLKVVLWQPIKLLFVISRGKNMKKI